MITVQVQRKVKGQTMTQTVQLHHCHQLTPETARDAMQVAFGSRWGGVVWWDMLARRGLGYGFRLYPKSHKKIYHL